MHGSLRGHTVRLAAWLGLPLFIACKQALAMRLCWGYGVGIKDLLGEAAFGLLGCVAACALLRLRRWRHPLAGFLLVDLFLSVLLLMDVLHARQFGSPVSVAMLRYADQLVEVRGAVWALLAPKDLLLFVDLPVVLLLGPWWRRWPDPGRTPLRVAMAVVLGAAVVAAGGVALFPPNPFLRNTGIAWRVGFLDYHLYDLASAPARAAGRRRAPPGVKERLVVDLRATPAAPRGPLRGAGRGANLIVLQVESLQDFVLGHEVGGSPVAPRIDGLARESLRASSFYQQTGGGRTSDADLATNCSLLPFADRAAAFAYDGNHYRCLASVLSEAGYRTAAFESGVADFWNMRRSFQAYGFQEFHSFEGFVQDDLMGPGISDCSFLRQTRTRLAGLPRPFFAYLETFSSHTPFEHGEPLPGAPLPTGLLRPYLESVHYTDRCIGEFLDGLRASGLLDRSVLVLYGDHDGVPWSRKVGAWLGQPDDDLSRVSFVRRVPLLIRLPHGARAGPLDGPMGQVDLAPTLAGLLDVLPRRTMFLGREHGSDPLAPIVFPNGDAIDRARLLVVGDGGTGAGARRCIDLSRRSVDAVESCDDLARAARTAIDRSRTILEYDLGAAAE